MKIRILLLHLTLASAAYVAYAQPPVVLFRTGPEVLPENARAFADKGTIAANEMVGDYFYRILQFYQQPTAQQHAQLTAQGIVLLDYIPHHAYIAALPVGLTPEVLTLLGIRSIVPIHPWRKLSPPIRAGDFGSWALARGYASVIVKFYKNIPRDLIHRFCESKGWTIEKDNGYNNYLQLRIRTNELMELAREPWVAFIDQMPEPGQPEDVLGRALHRANVLDSPLPSGRHYTGEGLSVCVRDDGAIGPHIDFQGRLNQDFVGPSSGSHGDMVAGIFAGAGNIDPYVRGMAAGAQLFVIDYDATFLDETMDLHYDYGVLVTNSSYSNGCNAGYTAITETVDQQIYENPTLIHVFSAGNSNNNDCGYGAGDQWGNITGGHKQGKNVLATANLNADASLVNTSSRGPAYDGRIKPDIAANGRNQMSTDPDNGYAPGGGTSAASPGIAGVTTQLIHAYQTIYGTLPATGLIKAIMLNTANDLGNKGPDFQFGWGHVNAWRAVLTIEEGRFFEAEVAVGQTLTHTIQVPDGVKQLRIMTYWMDPPATAMAAKALINDLDTRLLAPDGSVHLPWVLDPTPNPSTLAQPATTGIDTLNNMEQVAVDNPPAGTWTLEVTGKEVPFGTKSYFVVYEFRTNDIAFTRPAGGEQFVPGETERIHWDAEDNSGSFTLSYSFNDGQSWQTIATLGGDKRMFDWQVPAILGAHLRLRLSRNGIEAISEPFTIMYQPQNAEVVQACPNFIRVEWDAPANADSFVLYRLGSRYMDSVAITTNTWYEFPTQANNPTLDHWFAVAAYGPDGQLSRRTVAINYNEGLFNCPLDHDIQLLQIAEPQIEDLLACDVFTTDLTVQLRNGGQSDEDSLTLYYQVNDEPPTSVVLTNLQVGSELNFTFPSPLEFFQPGTYTLKVWSTLPNDEAPFNDTLIHTFTLAIVVGDGATPPMYEQFDYADWPPLNWLVRNPDEYITWTPREVIGPDGQNTIAAFINNFQYNDTGQRDDLITTPVDLTNIDRAVLEFDYAYARYSSEYYDRLVVEVLTDCGTTLSGVLFDKEGTALATTNDVTDIFVPDNPSVWSHEVIDLSDYTGNSITVRFANITGYGNSLVLDNIHIRPMQAPLIEQITIDAAATPCEGDFIVFEAEAQGDFLDYQWSFGIDATPQTATGPGPHSVQFTGAGTYEVSLTATNSLGSDTASTQVQIAPYPQASFEVDIVGQVVTFTNQAQNADTWLWDFGDGETSTVLNPVHVYLQMGVYVVTLSASNDCGTQVATDTLYIGVNSASSTTLPYRFSLSPNPAQTHVDIALQGPATSQQLELELLDLHGHRVRHQQIQLSPNTMNLTWSLDLPKGVYLVRLRDAQHAIVRMLVVQ